MFIRTIESFTCEHCGVVTHGDGYTNHCAKCLWSKHVDIDPGDRQANCGGLMKPIATRFEHDMFVITHRCVSCGHEKVNKASAGDDTELLISLTARPLEN